HLQCAQGQESWSKWLLCGCPHSQVSRPISSASPLVITKVSCSLSSSGLSIFLASLSKLFLQGLDTHDAEVAVEAGRITSDVGHSHFDVPACVEALVWVKFKQPKNITQVEVP